MSSVSVSAAKQSGHNHTAGHVSGLSIKNHVKDIVAGSGGPGQPASRSIGDTSGESYDDFFSEIQDIAQDEDRISREEPHKSPEHEGEVEAGWLRQAGYDDLVAKFEEGQEIDEDLITDGTSSLTQNQAAAVKKRVNTLNATLRKKKNKHNKPDMRDLFTLPPESASSGIKVGEAAVVMRRKPTSPPLEETVGKRGSHRSSHLLKHRRGYDMSGDADIPKTRSATEGIETLSINPREQPGELETRHRASDSVLIMGSQENSLLRNRLPDLQANHQIFTEHVVPKDNLPNFEIVPDSLGLTRIDSLDDADIERLRKLALLEFSALFDSHNLSYENFKTKKRFKESGLFGVPLHTLLENDQQRIHQPIRVPLILQELLGYLIQYGVNEEGILRVPGAVARIKSLRQELEDHFYTGKFRWDTVRPNDAAGLLKLFLRELPIPLLTFQYLDAFTQLQLIKDKKDQLQALNHLIILLPNVHRDTLLLLLQFLIAVVNNVENKMTMNNVAMIMAPNLFMVVRQRSKSADERSLPEQELLMAAGTSNLVRMLIKYEHILWTVPSFMMVQIRHQYEAEVLKPSGRTNILKLLGKKDKSSAYKKPPIQHEADYQAGIITVQMTHVNKSPTRFQLNNVTTAGDIINKLAADYTRSQKKVFLYEMGGNIGKRKLGSNTKMLDLYRVNPNASWVIQPDVSYY